MMDEYDVPQEVVTLDCDNTSAINIAKNPVQHSKTKHIEIRHHYIRDLVNYKILSLEHVSTENQLADIFTKPLDMIKFEKLHFALGVCIPDL